MDSPTAQTQRENVLVSFALLKASVAEQSVTKFNGDGVNTHILKNVV